MPDTRLGPRDVALKMVARAKARGPGEVVSLFVGRTRDAISSADVLKMYQRRTDTRQETSVRPTFVFREGGASDGAAYARDIGTESPETFRRRLADGTHCFLVLTDDLVVHTSWMTTDKAWTREVASYVCPPPGEGYIYESFTRPELRGQGIYPFALERITNWMVHHGLTRAWVGVEASNRSSLRAVAKAGFTEGFEVAYRRRLGRVSLDPPSGPLAHAGRRLLRRCCPPVG
jgi:GNAT superfamily N-acetyltransferase